MVANSKTRKRASKASRRPKLKRAKPKLRFAALIRVSTEKQERKGESLTTQDTQIVQAVEQIGGKVVRHYAGQEHGTAGWEREQLDQLLADAAKKPRPFDAVIVADPSRWSRDNVRNETGLEILRENGVRFFTLQTEHDLNNDQARLFLSMSAVVNGYSARVTARKSLDNRIARAKRCGAPTGGSKPHGRIWNKQTETWSVDKDAQKTIKEIAKRYLAGESMRELAEEYGFTHPGLHKILTQRSGTQWVQKFRSKSLNIEEEIVTEIPRLLPDKTIEAIRKLAAANKTWNRKSIKHDYLLSRMIFCGHCGSALAGQHAGSGYRYYRHYSKKENCLHGWIPAELIEDEVVERLRKLFGNVAAIKKAVERARPDRDKIDSLFSRRERIIKEFSNIEASRTKLVNLMVDEDLPEDDVKIGFAQLKERRAKAQASLDKIDAELGGQPNLEAIEKTAELVSKSETIRYWLAKNKVPTFEEQKKLVQTVFGGTTADGRRMGVYLTNPSDEEMQEKANTWNFELVGTFENVLTNDPKLWLGSVTRETASQPRSRRRSSGL